MIPQQNSNLSPTVTIGDWIVYMILMMIPIVNIIMFIVFAFDSSKPSRANLIKAQLLLLLILLIPGIIIFFALLGGAMNM
ncbi:MAG: hypothetical protein K5787_15115 [Lentisphaeria bacterium]|nr:hypothetical protein [Lentisphaeria bacterium]